MKEAVLLEHVSGAVGLDEAGRGPLAGPVVAAAVLVPDGFCIEGIDDSKKLDAPKREELALRIRQECRFAIAWCDHVEVDRLNILWASMEAMKRALALLGVSPKRILVDGNRLPPGIKGEAIIKGDGRFACIAAASILAKTQRDQMMKDLAIDFPQYGFEKHFGYATPEHLDALRQHGPCSIHRRTFSPMKEDAQPCLTFES